METNKLLAILLEPLYEMHRRGLLNESDVAAGREAAMVYMRSRRPLARKRLGHPMEFYCSRCFAWRTTDHVHEEPSR